MKKISLVVASLGLLAIGGCKKKNQDNPEGTNKPVEGSNTMGSGSSMAGSSTAGSGSATAGSGSDTAAAKPMTPADMAEKYKTCTGSINAGKFDDFKKDCLSDKFVSHDLGMGADKQLDAVVDEFKGMFTAFPDMKIEPQVVFVSGKNIMAVGLFTGTNKGAMKTPMGELPATNKKVGLLMFHRLAIDESGKASEEWAFMDPNTMMGQLGLLPKEAPKTRPAMEKGMDGAPMVVITADDEKEKKNLATWKKMDDAFSANKMDDMGATLADDAVESDQAHDVDVKGKKELEKGAKMFRDGFSDGKLTGTQYWAAGDYVISVGKFEGTHDHDLGPLKKTGKKVSLDVAEIGQFNKDGKVQQMWRFHSSMQFAMQLGLMPEMKHDGGAAGSGSAAAPAGSGAAPAGSAAAPDKK